MPLSLRLRSTRFPWSKYPSCNLRREIYLCLPEEGEGTYSRELVANHLLHSSYVSYETVLSRAGVIPERVALLKSSCMKRSKVFDNATGRYEYTFRRPRLIFRLA